MKNVLIANSFDDKCGVHQYGLNLASILKGSISYNFLHYNMSSAEELITYARYADYVIHNWHPHTTPFINQSLIDQLNEWGVKQLMIVGHDHYASFKNVSYIDCDCTKTNGIPRPILNVENLPDPEKLTVGSFGFAFDFKNFDTIPRLVAAQLPDAKLRMHLTPHAAGDSSGRIAAMVQNVCDELGIELELSQNFMTGEDLVRFLAANSINVFLYPEGQGRGLSSSIDFAFAANKPVALSDSFMFRHVENESRFFLKNHTLSEIISFGTGPLNSFREVWSNENVIKFIEDKLA